MKQVRNLFIWASLLAGAGAIAQSKQIKGNGNPVKQDRNVGQYTAVAVSGSMDVWVSPGTTGKITVQADDNLQAYIVTEVKDGTLQIKVKENYSINGKNIKIMVPASQIDAAKVAGSGSIHADQPIASGGKFAASVAGSGDIKFQTAAKDVNASISGSGSIELGGKSERLKVSIAGSGDFKGYNLQTNDAAVSISGSGNVETYASTRIEASIAGSGSVFYKGNAQTSLKASGSGKLSKADK
jgi:hypothetical protein